MIVLLLLKKRGASPRDVKRLPSQRLCRRWKEALVEVVLVEPLEIV